MFVKRREQFVPNYVEFGLHVGTVRSDRDDCVLIGDHDAELSCFAVTSKCIVTTSPELKAVALIPIATRIASVRNLF